LRAGGWEVVVVVAYRTVAARPADAVLAAAGTADAIAFTSGSSVDAYVRAAGAAALPPVVVAIGPVSAAAAARHGIDAAVADPHSLEGLVEATVAALA
jgi:uroporphyrinogen-III synthase